MVIDRLAVNTGDKFRKRLTDSVESALKYGQGRLIVHIIGREDIPMSEARSCCGIAYPDLAPALFSFNSPLGMCPTCNGIGSRLSMDEEKIIPAGDLTIREGAVVPWRNYFMKSGEEKGSWGGRQLKAAEEQWGIDFDAPWNKLPEKHKKILLHGAGDQELKVLWNSEKIQGEITMAWEGLLNTLMRRYLQTESEHQKKYYAGFMSSQTCEECRGAAPPAGGAARAHRGPVHHRCLRNDHP